MSLFIANAYAQDAAPAGPARNLAPWLALWLALAWLLERWVAERRTVTRA